MRTVTLIVALFLVALVPSGPALAVDHDHWQVVGKICQTGVTPEARAGHEEFVAKVSQKGTGDVSYFREIGLRTWTIKNTTNFGGFRPLELVYADCVQAR